MATLRSGEWWQLDARLKRPRGTVNPHGFDFEAWQLERGIAASGSVMARGDNRALQTGAVRAVPTVRTVVVGLEKNVMLTAAVTGRSECQRVQMAGFDVVAYAVPVDPLAQQFTQR